MNRELDAMIAEQVFHWKECPVPKDYDGLNAGVVLSPNGLPIPGISWPNKGLVHRAYLCPDWSGSLHKAIELANHVGLVLPSPCPTDPQVIAIMALERHQARVRYDQMIVDLTAWFQERLKELPKLRLTQAEISVGTDSLTGKHAALVQEAHRVFFKDKGYELSYNQVCRSFFEAARALKKLVTSKGVYA